MGIAAKRCAEVARLKHRLCRECRPVKDHVVVQPAIPTSSTVKGNG